MKIAAMLFVAMSIVIISMWFFDEKMYRDGIRQCWSYAVRDHEHEMVPERWEYLKSIGNPNDPEFFYQSCISSLTGKPAIKRYMR